MSNLRIIPLYFYSNYICTSKLLFFSSYTTNVKEEVYYIFVMIIIASYLIDYFIYFYLYYNKVENVSAVPLVVMALKGVMVEGVIMMVEEEAAV